MERARGVLEKSFGVEARSGAGDFLRKVLRNDGKYDDAASRLRGLLAQYPGTA